MVRIIIIIIIIIVAKIKVTLSQQNVAGAGLDLVSGW